MIVQRSITENALQEATAIVRDHEVKGAMHSRWTCEVCGMLHGGAEPTSCDTCGASTFAPALYVRREIGHSW